MSNKRKSSQIGRPAKRANIASTSAPAENDDEYLGMGIIEQVSLKNFMCHTELTMTFATNVNFIIGKNGSGKSAIITAIVVGLGGKASSTSRGSSLKTLIKEGSANATVEITLRNHGSEAYKVDLYGEKIAVERRLFADGQTYYRIKNENGKLISTKKEDLVQILDQFNIQVDNPLTCLNQEMSKHFLHSKNETDKYKFFMKSTQLEQMSLDYAFVQEHRVTMQETLSRKERLLPDLEREVLAKEQKYKNLSTITELKDKVVKLRGELAWADVIQLESALKPVQKQIEQEQKRTQKYEQAVDKAKRLEKEAKSAFEEAQKEIREYVEKAKSLDPVRTSSKKEYDRVRGAYRQLENRIKTVLKQRKDTMADKRELQKRIKDLMESANTDIESEKKNRETTLRNLRRDSEQLVAQMKNNSEQIQQFEGAISNCKDEIDEGRKEARRVTTEKQNTSERLRSLASGKKSRLQLFGVRMPKFVQRIEEEWRRKKFRKKPRGPIGACVTLKDASMAVPVESAIRSHMYAFVVDNHHDMKTLSQLRSAVFSPKEASQISIYTREFGNDVYNISSGRVNHNRFKCVFDLLNIEDPVVANCLIDMGSIETILVIPQLRDAMQVMQLSPRPPAKCTLAFTVDGDEVYQDRFYSNPREPVSRYLKADVDDEIKRCEHELKNCDLKLDDLQKAIQKKENECRRLQNELKRLEQTNRQSRTRLREFKVEISELEAIEDVAPPDVRDLQDEVENHERQIESLNAIIDKENEDLSRMNDSVATAAADWKKHDAEMRKVKDTLDESRESISRLENEVEKAKNDRRYYDESLKKHVKSVSDAIDKKKKEEELMERSREEARRVCAERVSTRRAPATVANEIQRVEFRIAQNEQEHGQREQIITEYYEVKKKYKVIRQGIEWVKSFLKAVALYLKQRQESFLQMRQLISMRCKMTFDTLMQQRGFAGKMNFVHTERLLQLCVQPGDDGVITSDMRALSGGERSFSTVCFVLSLWEEIQSPFRCLDEFDVYMDMANRRVAMEMMLEISMHDLMKQFIFLTPHDISSLPRSDQIRVWKMADPERGQGGNGVASD